MILPENEFSHLKGVNKQPYLDDKKGKSLLPYSLCHLNSTQHCNFTSFDL